MEMARARFRGSVVIVVFVLGVINGCSAELRSPEEQTAAANQLVTRVIPRFAEYFHIQVDPRTDESEYFSIKKDEDNKIEIKCSSGVTGAWALNHYLKYYCNSQISWDFGVEHIDVPVSHLPDVDLTVNISTSFRHRYYANVCTFSYSFVWWKWKEWQKHIDWMALNGINLPLASLAYEAVLDEVFAKFGASAWSRNDFFSGPAFLAWGRMGNLKTWGGPLPDYWLEDQLVLQKMILDRSRSLGMKPVLPCFPGFVTEDIVKANPGAPVQQLSSWNGFLCPNQSCLYLLDPSSDLYARMSQTFIDLLIQKVGTDHYYSCDLFNENGVPAGVQPVPYLDAVGKGVYYSMAKVDPRATWVMQGWMFENAQWSFDNAKALLTSVPLGRMLVLDLYAELSPQFARLESYFGQPFVYCLLNNFGGRKGMFGDLWSIMEDPGDALRFPNSTIAGIGLAMEGIHSNYILYSAFLESPLRFSSPNLSINDTIKWTHQYGMRRYGISRNQTSAPNEDAETLSNATWTTLANTVYTAHPKLPPHGHPIVAKRPNLKLQPFIWYPPKSIWDAWKNLVSLGYEIELSGGILTPGLKQDIVDVGRQCFEVQIDLLYGRIVDAFRAKSISDVLSNGTVLMETLKDMDALLQTDGNFLLGRWLRGARRWAYDEKDVQLLRFNALNQITWWGPKAEILDYAFKQWSGVISYYVTPRWEAFIQYLVICIASAKPYKQKEFDLIASRVEYEFISNPRHYPSQPVGDVLQVSRRLYEKWNKIYL